jgi:hypothetical protein
MGNTPRCHAGTAARRTCSARLVKVIRCAHCFWHAASASSKASSSQLELYPTDCADAGSPGEMETVMEALFVDTGRVLKAAGRGWGWG